LCFLLSVLSVAAAVVPNSDLVGLIYHIYPLL
jgi:hypothetical protein